MPTLRIMSLYTKRKREFAADLRYARVRLEQFRDALPIRFGEKLAGAIRTEAWFRDSGIHGGRALAMRCAAGATDWLPRNCFRAQAQSVVFRGIPTRPGHTYL